MAYNGGNDKNSGGKMQGAIKSGIGLVLALMLGTQQFYKERDVKPEAVWNAQLDRGMSQEDRSLRRKREKMRDRILWKMANKKKFKSDRLL